MSYGLMPYVVSIEKLIEVCGSANEPLVGGITQHFGDALAFADEELGYAAAQDGPSHALAIRHLIMGEPLNLPPELYAYGFKFIVRFFGEHLDNRPFSPCELTFLTDEIDVRLKEMGTTLRMAKLVFRGAPVDFPRLEDFPLIGYWTVAEMQDNYPVLKDHKPLARPLVTIRSWLRYTNKRHQDIVAFYH